MKDRTIELLKHVSSLQEWERKFVGDLINISGEFQKYMKEADCTMDQFCVDFEMSRVDAQKLLNGGIDYSMKHLAMLEHLWTVFRRSRVNKEVIKVVNQEKS
jgi:hypothetical protein